MAPTGSCARLVAALPVLWPTGGSARQRSLSSLRLRVVEEDVTRDVDRDGLLPKAWIQMQQAGVQEVSVHQLAPSAGTIASGSAGL
jgi:hypothetical protein